jgi:uncharacterized membrane protein SpoIIM required for sporulation
VILPQNLLLIPAYILAGVVGVYTAWQIVKYNQGRKVSLKPDILHSLFTTIVWGGIVVVGALIEIYLSPIIMNLVFHYI